MKKDRSIFTEVVHADIDISKNHGALSVPIYNSSTYAFQDADESAEIHNYQKPGYFYGRLGNPTQAALEKAVAKLERAESAIAFGSGMAAISAAIFSLAKSGDHIVALESMYSTATKLLRYVAESFDIEVTFIDATDPENYRSAIRENTKIFWTETPSNPRLNITDLSAVAGIAKENGIITVTDNTFATPFNQNPIKLGIDLVAHSATKYLGGHSDLSAGVLAGNSDLIQKVFDKGVKLIGGAIAPQVAWLVLRGIKTLALRMKQHNDNAYAIAHMLQCHAKIIEVFYPGFETHQNHDLAKRQMRGFGGMVSFDVGDADEARRFVNELKLCSNATSLGGVETIIQHSAAMTHAMISKEDREKAGISDGLIRMSVGIEDKADLIEDLEQALANI